MLAVSLGFACNNACVFCAQGELRVEGRDRARASAAAAERLERLDGLASGDVVAFVGGEPTLAEELPALVRAADARGASRIVLQTNGRRLAYRGYAAALRAASPRLSLDVSLHGSTAPMHDYHTSTPQSFAQTVQGLANARAVGLPFAVTTVVTRSNFRHLAEIVRLAGALGARAVQLSLAAPHGRAARAAARVVPAPELVAPHLARALVDAASLGLGFRAGGRLSSPGIAAWFAGLGEVEAPDAQSARAEGALAARSVEAPSAPAEGARRVALQMLGRPAPARAEVHTQSRRTGAELRPLFPALFGGADTAAPIEPEPPTGDALGGAA